MSEREAQHKLSLCLSGLVTKGGEVSFVGLRPTRNL
jgi:hypothetical protein